MEASVAKGEQNNVLKTIPGVVLVALLLLLHGCMFIGSAQVVRQSDTHILFRLSGSRKPALRDARREARRLCGTRSAKAVSEREVLMPEDEPDLDERELQRVVLFDCNKPRLQEQFEAS